MKTLAVLFAIFMSSLAMGQENSAGSISVNVENVQSNEGKVMVGLYTSDTFMKAKPDYGRIGKIENGQASVTFDSIPPGTYAIICFHDKNDNDHIDFDESGMPAENYGLSNNPYAYGPPQWEEAKFSYDGGEKAIEIRF